jgi:hypothetical protein
MSRHLPVPAGFGKNCGLNPSQTHTPGAPPGGRQAHPVAPTVTGASRDAFVASGTYGMVSARWAADRDSHLPTGTCFRVAFGPLARTAPVFLAALCCCLIFTSCEYRPPPPPGPIPCRAGDLWAAYRDDPGAAALAFGDQPVVVLVTTSRRDGADLVCDGIVGNPPILRFRFAAVAPEPVSPSWIVGTCRGADVDGTVLVTDARPAGPPTQSAP